MPYENSEECVNLKEAADKTFPVSIRPTTSQLEDQSLQEEFALTEKLSARGARDPELRAYIAKTLG